MKNTYLVTGLVALVVGGAGFFGGVQYQKSQRPTGFQGQFRSAGGSGAIGGRQGGFGGANRPVAGEIINSDAKSMTVKLQDGSSKIVLLPKNVSIGKMDTGSSEDLKAGIRVAVFGSTNPDGSVTAQSVQLNPQIRVGMPTPSSKE